MHAFRAIRDPRSRLRSLLGVLAWITILAGAAGSTSFDPFELPVVVEERPGLVRLHVLLPDGISVESIEVRIADRKVVVFGRYRSGQPTRSRPIRLSQSVSPQDVEASFADDGSLTITLHAVTEGGS